MPTHRNPEVWLAAATRKRLSPQPKSKSTSSYLSLDPISQMNKLPNPCNKPEARRLGAKHVSDEQHEEILMKLHVMQLWIMMKCQKMNPTATVIHTAAALMTVGHLMKFMGTTDWYHPLARK
jgi:hypothetical protein